MLKRITILMAASIFSLNMILVSFACEVDDRWPPASGGISSICSPDYDGVTVQDRYLGRIDVAAQSMLNPYFCRFLELDRDAGLWRAIPASSVGTPRSIPPQRPTREPAPIYGNHLWDYPETTLYMLPRESDTHRIGDLVWNPATSQWESDRLPGQIYLTRILNDPNPCEMDSSSREYVDCWRAHIIAAMRARRLDGVPQPTTPVPEPSTIVLLCAGIAGLVFSRRQFDK